MTNCYDDLRVLIRCAELRIRLASFLLGLGRHLGPLSLAVYISYFALFSLIIWVLGDILDENCSSWAILAIYHYAAFLGWLIYAAQWKISIRGTALLKFCWENLSVALLLLEMDTDTDLDRQALDAEPDAATCCWYDRLWIYCIFHFLFV